MTNMNLSSKSIVLLILACVGHFLVDTMIGIWPLFKLEAGIDIALAALLTGACVLVGEGLQVYFGALADRGFTLALLALGPVFAAVSAFLPYGNGFYFFGFCLICTYVGSSAFHPTAAGVVSSLNPKRANVMIAIFHSSGLVGLALSQTLYSMTTYGRAFPISWLLAVPAALLAIALFILRSRVPIEKTIAKKSEVHFLKVVLSYFKIQPLRLLYFTLLFNQIVIWSIMFLLPDFIISRTDVPWMVLGGGNLMYVLGAACAAVPLGLLADRLQPQKVIFTVMMLASGVLYTLLLSSALSPLSMSILLFLAGGCLGAVQPLSIALGTKIMPSERGMISAFLMGFVWIFSEGVGISLSGVLASLFSEDAAAKSLLIMSLGAIASSILAYRLMRAQKVSTALAVQN